VLIALPPAEAEENQKTESTEKEKRDTLHVAVRNSIKSRRWHSFLSRVCGVLFGLASHSQSVATNWPKN